MLLTQGKQAPLWTGVLRQLMKVFSVTSTWTTKKQARKPKCLRLSSWSQMEQKKWNCTLLFNNKKHFTLAPIPCWSTITYDTLVRAGVNTTSAFVPDIFSDCGAETRVSPPAAKGSRGINIMPDIYFELSLCGPVSPIILLSSTNHTNPSFL